MPTKADTYRQMADHATANLTGQVKDWTRFLVTAGQLYKYNFLDQVLIHVQRPGATACAEFDFWSRRMDRHIKSGSKGIVLLHTHNGRLDVRHVYDISDTEPRKNGRDPVPWQYGDEHQAAVTARLEECFHVPGGDGLAKQLITLAVRIADEHWHDFKDKILLSVHDSLLDELDEDNVALRFRSAVTVSLSFLLLARCGFDLDTYFTPEDFECIGEFNTRDTVLVLGNTVSSSACVILRQVEYAIKRHIRDPQKQPIPESTAAGDKKPAAAPVSEPEPFPAVAPEPPQEVPQPPKAAPVDAPAPPQPVEAAASAPTVPAQSETPVDEPAPEQMELFSLPPSPAPKPAPVLPTPVPAAGNFRITDDDLGSFGPKGRYVLNVEAIQTLRNIEAEGRGAMEAEQEMLSRYTGWGAIPEAFDPDKADWADEYRELKALLTEDEYVSARASTLNAHFTPPVVIRAIYEALGNMGFVSGNILEPSCGVGNFFGCLPESMAASRLYGVELDGITGRIARQLYPEANIAVRGYEKTDFPRDFFDIAVGNVPFGDYKVNDPAYDKLGFTIHNYFFAKALDQLRPGGILAFVTSRYTMDSKDSAVRKHLSQRADLLGAIRLPNTAFKANAGTDVVADIIFLQKREDPAVELPDWGVSVMENQDGYPVNSYFLDYPEMVLGCPGVESTRYGHDYTVYPAPGADLAQQLHEAVARIHGQYKIAEVAELEAEETAGETIPADPAVKNFSYTVVDGTVYYRENSVMVKSKLNAMATARVKGMVQLRECVHQLIDLQLDENVPDSALLPKQAELDRLYDAFTRRYGLINGRGNRLAFDKDSSYYLLCSLEVLDDDGNMERKADIFTQRTIKQHKSVTHVDTASEALVVSIGERARVDLPFMARLTGKPEAELVADLRGVIFQDPEAADGPLSGWQTADEYLSGNVRRKLREAQRAAEKDPAFQANVTALEAVQPKDLEASEIEVRVGATWIDKGYYQQFMYETFRTPASLRRGIQVQYSPHTAEWFVTGKKDVPYNDVAAYTTYGTKRANAYEILEDSLNLRDVRIYDTVTDPDGKDRRVINGKETTLAVQKQQAVRDAFQTWLWKDPERRQALVRLYNDTMNCIRPREYDGSHIVFSGINPGIRLQPPPGQRHRPRPLRREHPPGPRGGGRENVRDDRVGHGGQTPGAVQQVHLRGPQPSDSADRRRVPAPVPRRRHPGDDETRF